ncbi:hypothetical protein [Qipengyuania seohaensis]|uniref:hypothetical protein n=1 Tax=Qipengyuania seohaensis TaxID=266951 RepID=UPI000C2210C8|nr:hypothetical protein [Qipengyuania seohaensis]
MALDQLGEFKAALADLDNQVILDRFYYSRQALMLDGDAEAQLRRSVAKNFGVAMRDVIVTGSAKLGFTIVAKEKRPIFSPFADESDIDIAIISADLFTSLWKDAAAFVVEHGQGSWPDANSFRKYLLRGWLRPDRLPKTAEFPRSKAWFDFFRLLTASGEYGPYKITGGVYYDEQFWETYAASSFDSCRLAIETPI